MVPAPLDGKLLGEGKHVCVCGTLGVTGVLSAFNVAGACGTLTLLRAMKLWMSVGSRG